MNNMRTSKEIQTERKKKKGNKLCNGFIDKTKPLPYKMKCSLKK